MSRAAAALLPAAAAAAGGGGGGSAWVCRASAGWACAEVDAASAAARAFGAATEAACAAQCAPPAGGAPASAWARWAYDMVLPLPALNLSVGNVTAGAASRVTLTQAACGHARASGIAAERGAGLDLAVRADGVGVECAGYASFGGAGAEEPELLNAHFAVALSQSSFSSRITFVRAGGSVLPTSLLISDCAATIQLSTLAFSGTQGSGAAILNAAAPAIRAAVHAEAGKLLCSPRLLVPVTDKLSAVLADLAWLVGPNSPLPHSTPAPEPPTSPGAFDWDKVPLLKATRGLDAATQNDLVGALVHSTGLLTAPSTIAHLVPPMALGPANVSVAALRIGGLDSATRASLLRPAPEWRTDGFASAVAMRGLNLTITLHLSLQTDPPLVDAPLTIALRLRNVSVALDAVLQVDEAAARGLTVGQLLEPGCIAPTVRAAALTRADFSAAGAELELGAGPAAEAVAGALGAAFGGLIPLAANAAAGYAVPKLNAEVSRLLRGAQSNATCDPAPNPLAVKKPRTTLPAAGAAGVAVGAVIAIAALLYAAWWHIRAAAAPKTVDDDAESGGGGDDDSGCCSECSTEAVTEHESAAKAALLPRGASPTTSLATLAPALMERGVGARPWAVWAVQFVIPALAIAANTCRIYALVQPIAKVTISVNTIDQVLLDQTMINFSFKELCYDFYHSGAWFITIVIVGGACAKPLAMNLVLLWCWWGPMTRERRVRVVTHCGHLAKIATVDVLFMCLLVDLFNDTLKGGNSVTVKLHAEPILGIFAGTTGSVLTKFACHAMLALDRASAPANPPTAPLLCNAAVPRRVRLAGGVVLIAGAVCYVVCWGPVVVTMVTSGFLGAIQDYTQNNKEYHMYTLFRLPGDSTNKVGARYIVSLYAVLMLIAPIMTFAGWAAVWLLPLRGNWRATCFRFTQQAASWNAIDIMFLVLFMAWFEMDQVAQFIINHNFGSLTDTAKQYLGEEVLTINPQYHTGNWFLLSAAVFCWTAYGLTAYATKRARAAACSEVA